MGLPIIEAASFSKSAVALNFAAAAEVIISGQTGYVASDFSELLFFTKRLIDKPDLRRRMGIRAYQRAQHIFDWSKIADKYIDIFTQVIKKHVEKI